MKLMDERWLFVKILGRCGRLWTRRGAVGALSACVTLGTVSPSFMGEQTHSRPMSIRGFITSVDSDGMQLRTSTGMEMVGISRGTTRIVRLATGSTGDVTAGRRVDLHLERGTRIADSIRIELTGPPSHHPTMRSTPQPGLQTVKHTVHPMPPEGDVVSFSGNTLTLRYPNGTNGSYTVSQSVNVIEALAGSFNDLAMGETVQVFLSKSGGPATTVIITNA